MKNLILFLFILSATNSIAQDGFNQKKHRFSFSAGFAVPTFSNDERISGGTTAAKGFTSALRIEFPLVKELRLMTGADFTWQSQTVSTYFFAPGHSEIFDENYNYSHEIKYSEVSLPVLISIPLVKRPQDKVNSAYFIIGWSLKHIMLSRGSIYSDIEEYEVYSGKINLDFEHHLLDRRTGSTIMAGIGADHKIGKLEKSFFIETTYRYGIHGYRYNGVNNSNSLFFRNSNVSVVIGYRF